jgi:hypothetical protein
MKTTQMEPMQAKEMQSSLFLRALLISMERYPTWQPKRLLVLCRVRVRGTDRMQLSWPELPLHANSVDIF